MERIESWQRGLIQVLAEELIRLAKAPSPSSGEEDLYEQARGHLAIFLDLDLGERNDCVSKAPEQPRKLVAVGPSISAAEVSERTGCVTGTFRAFMSEGWLVRTSKGMYDLDVFEAHEEDMKRYMRDRTNRALSRDNSRGVGLRSMRSTEEEE